MSCYFWSSTPRHLLQTSGDFLICLYMHHRNSSFCDHNYRSRSIPQKCLAAVSLAVCYRRISNRLTRRTRYLSYPTLVPLITFVSSSWALCHSLKGMAPLSTSIGRGKDSSFLECEFIVVYLSSSSLMICLGYPMTNHQQYSGCGAHFPRHQHIAPSTQTFPWRTAETLPLFSDCPLNPFI